MRTLSPAALQAGFEQQTDEVFLVLLQITHPNLPDAIRVVNNNENVTSGGALYVAYPFEIELPGEDSDQPPLARLRIDNVDRLLVATVREIATPPQITIRVVLASQPDTIELQFQGLTMRNVTYDAATISGELVFEQILVEPVATVMTPSKFPGLF